MSCLEYQLVFAENFYKQLDKLDHSVRQRLPQIFEKLKQHPKLGKQLHGKWNYYRVRFLNYRLIYTADDNKLVVLILDVGKRDAIYG